MENEKLVTVQQLGHQFKRTTGHVNGQAQLQPLLVGLPDGTPFICLPGTREYHHHSDHSNDPWAGKPLQIFYAEVICGGVMIQLSGGTHMEAAEVVLAFESAMAGILLGANLLLIVTDCGANSDHTQVKFNAAAHPPHF